MKRLFSVFLLLVIPCAAVAVQEPVGDQTSTVAGRTYKGVELTCDLPGSQHMKNRGGSDGAGCCVFSAIEHAALWAGMEDFRGFRDWCAQGPGGGWPQKVDQLIARFCKERGIAIPPYMQYEGNDIASLLALIDKTGRMACLTYGWSPRYGQKIAHMTNCPHFRGNFGVCLDNNFPGEENYEWMTREELVRRCCYGSGGGWIFVWLDPPPPPLPTN